jgi:hypothetical protein
MLGMTDRERELEQRIRGLVVNLRSFAMRLARSETIVQGVQDALKASPVVTAETLKNIHAGALGDDPSHPHPVILLGESIISDALQGFVSQIPKSSDY